MVAWIASAIAAWSPQFLYNISLGSSSILPVARLFDVQVKWGILLLKYTTVVVKEQAVGLSVPNPWCIEPVSDIQPWRWYFEHPIHGMATMAGHLFTAFDYDYLFVYVYNFDPIYSPLIGVPMWMVATLGIFNGIKLLRHCLLSKITATEHLPTIAMVSALFLTVTALNSVLAVENRYNMIPASILSVLAVHFLLSCFRKSQYYFKATVLITALCIALLGAIFSAKARRSAIELMSDVKRYPCIASVVAQPPPGNMSDR
jgi:hypothetical protein